MVISYSTLSVTMRCTYKYVLMKWLIVGQSDEAELASRDTEPPIVPNDVPSQTRNPSNQFFPPSILMQVYV